MARVDENETEADFIEFEFPDEAAAERADRSVAFAAHTGGTTRVLRADPARVGTVREALERSGITWTESESGITEDDMWPSEPGAEDAAPDEDGPSGPGL